MKISFLVGGAIGYVLGARAGRERYEAIVRLGRQVSGSQTVQSTAGVLQAQVDGVRHRAKGVVSTKLHGRRAAAEAPGANGRQH